MKYLRADASLRQSYSLPTDAPTKLLTALESPLNEDDERLAASADEALVEFDHGAALKSCDWAMSPEDGPFANTAHRGAVTELVAVSGIRARLRFRDGDLSGAVDDMFAAMAAARHLSVDGSLASLVISYKLESKLSQVLAENLYLLSPTQLAALERKLDRLPTGSNLKKAFDAEKLHRDDLTPIAQEARNRDELIEHLLTGAPALHSDRELATQIIDGCGSSVSGYLNCIQQQQAFYASFDSRFSLAPQDFESEYRAQIDPLARINPLIRLMTPNLPRFRWTEAYTATRRALLRAAIAIRENGRAAPDRFPDPYDGKPFSYESTDTGFRIESRLKDDGTPISLTIPSNPKSNP